jgi:hypothetical protein
MDGWPESHHHRMAFDHHRLGPGDPNHPILPELLLQAHGHDPDLYLLHLVG